MDAMLFDRVRLFVNSDSHESPKAMANAVKATLDPNPELKYYEWKTFFEQHVIPGTPLEAHLRAVREESRNNSGNPNDHGKTRAEKVIYAMGWEELKREHEPRDGKEFGVSLWMREKNHPKLPPVDSVFPGKRQDRKTLASFTTSTLLAASRESSSEKIPTCAAHASSTRVLAFVPAIMPW